MGTTQALATEDVYTCPANCVAEVTYIHLANGATPGGSTRCRRYNGT